MQDARDLENVDGEIPRGKAAVQEWFHEQAETPLSEDQGES